MPIRYSIDFATGRIVAGIRRKLVAIITAVDAVIEGGMFTVGTRPLVALGTISLATSLTIVGLAGHDWVSSPTAGLEAGVERAAAVNIYSEPIPRQPPEPLVQVVRPQPAWAITVDGKEVVAVSEAEDAQAVIAGLQEEYRETILKDAISVEQLHFLEAISLQPIAAFPDQIRSRAEAKDILRFGTDKRIFHTVQRGDTLWDIARSRGLLVEDIIRANPHIAPESLQPGQQVSMTVQEPYVHLASSEIAVQTQSVPYPQEWDEDSELWPWQTRILQPGVPGQNRVTFRIHRQDGQEVSRETVRVERVSEPVGQIGVRGTKMAPDVASGELHWPAEGMLTSHFGLRWGRTHQGIDIAGRSGTPIYAADHGTVIYAGRLGQYGNAIQIDHGGGKLVTLYGHLSRIGVSPGQSVSKGQEIGAMGSSGRSTGPHLHFEIRIDGRSADPLRFYP